MLIAAAARRCGAVTPADGETIRSKPFDVSAFDCERVVAAANRYLKEEPVTLTGASGALDYGPRAVRGRLERRSTMLERAWARGAMVALVGIGMALLGSMACRKTGAPSTSRTVRRIGVVPKGTTHEFWRSVHAGARKAVEEASQGGTRVEMIWKGPLREDDREQQIQVVEGFTSQGVDGLVLAPLDEDALVRPVEEARRMKIATVIIDSALASDAIVSFVATDNRKGGELAADRLGSLLSGKGRILVLRYQEGSASTYDREEGFLERLKAAYPDVQVLSSDQHGGATRETAKRASENLLNRFGEQIQGVFAPNESTTTGMLLALQDAGLAGRVSFVGFDASPAFLDAMRRRELHGIVLQDPYKMGYLGVKTLLEQLEGRAPARRVDTGVALATPETMDEPALHALLHPTLPEA